MKDLGKSFSFAFKDPDWVPKFLIAALFMILAIVGIGIFVIAGYMVIVTRRAMKGEDRGLPDWRDLGVMFVLGFKYCIVYLLYLLPMFILFIPLVALSAITRAAGEAGIVESLAVIYSFGMILLVMPYSIAFTVIVPIINYRFAERGRIADALDISAVVRDFKANWQNTLVVALIAVGIQSLAGIGLVLLIVGVIFTIFYSYLVSAHMCGVLYRERKTTAESA